jgi:hypothetical protein
MNRNVQRLSQLITTFGPGAMVDLPTRSVLIGGLERWDMRERAFKPISEPRLTQLLERRLKDTNRLAPEKTLSLRTPPLPGESDRAPPPGVAVTVFPTWFVCDRPETALGSGRQRRRLVRWQDLRAEGGRRQFVADDGAKIDVTPLRFVGACTRGHLQDVDWRWAVHTGVQCREPMWLEERGTSADPADTAVVCRCGRSLSLQEAYIPGRLGRCEGARPWLGPSAREPCQNQLRLLTRTAANTYFPQFVPVISLPTGDDALSKLVHTHLADLVEASSPADVASARKFNSAVKATFAGHSDEAVFDALSRIRAAAASDARLPPKLAEFDILASGKAEIGENSPTALLYARTLPRAEWTCDVGIDLSMIKNVVAVHRLREVVCLYGFTRFEPAPTSIDGDLEDIRLAVDGAPLSIDADWLPAIEQFGEGLFLHFDEDRIGTWLARPDVQERARQLGVGHDTFSKRHNMQERAFPGAPYVMLHSLSHALLAEIALECGYPASAIKERVYALEDPVRRGSIGRCGILLYTATPGALGTLGGLVATAPRLAKILAAAIERLAICSNDPICADHSPADRADDRALLGAACHGCLLIPETSCEMRNLYLDRALVRNTMAGTNSGLFT